MKSGPSSDPIRRALRAASSTLGAIQRRVAAPLCGLALTGVDFGGSPTPPEITQAEVEAHPLYVERVRAGRTPFEAASDVRIRILESHDGRKGCGGGPLAPPAFPA